MTADVAGQGGDVLILARRGVQHVVLERLSGEFEILCPMIEPLPAALEQLDAPTRARVRVLLTLGSQETSLAAMAQLPRLGLICCTGSGYEGVDLVAARELGICVTNSPGVTASSVADLALALLIASVRQVFQASRALRLGRTERWTATAGLSGRRVGVYGMGAIGRKVACRLRACEAVVGHCSRSTSPDPSYCHFHSLLELAQWADDLVVCAPATPQTERSVDAAVLAALGRGAHVVNVARSSIIDGRALCDALENGTIAGVALDVYDPAQLPRLLNLPNVTLTPHIGGVTTQAEAGMSDAVLRNVTTFLAGAEVATPVPGSALRSVRGVAAA